MLIKIQLSLNHIRCPSCRGWRLCAPSSEQVNGTTFASCAFILTYDIVPVSALLSILEIVRDCLEGCGLVGSFDASIRGRIVIPIPTPYAHQQDWLYGLAVVVIVSDFSVESDQLYGVCFVYTLRSQWDFLWMF